MKRNKQQPLRTPAPEPSGTEWDRFTDLALENARLLRREAPGAPDPEGIETRVSLRRGLKTTWIRVASEAGSRALHKPMGTYVSLELQPEAFPARRDKNRLVLALAGELAAMMRLSPDQQVLAVGLGNRAVIYDALGPRTLDRVWVTRHLRGRLPESLGPIRPVGAFEPGVPGRTGAETGDLLRAAVDQLRPAALIAVDALAARNRASLGAVIQLSDAGLCPGAGVAAGRAALTRQTLGVPVFAMGVPLISTIETAPDFIVTHRALTAQLAFFAEILGRGINLALHSGLTEEQISQFVEIV